MAKEHVAISAQGSAPTAGKGSKYRVNKQEPAPVIGNSTSVQGIQHSQTWKVFMYSTLLAFRSENHSRSWVILSWSIRAHSWQQLFGKENSYDQKGVLMWAGPRRHPTELVGLLWGLGSRKYPRLIPLPYCPVQSCAYSLTLGVLCIYSSNTYWISTMCQVSMGSKIRWEGHRLFLYQPIFIELGGIFSWILEVNVHLTTIAMAALYLTLLMLLALC